MKRRSSASRSALIGGFTLVELIVILVILGIVSVAVLPRFVGRLTFDTRGAFDRVAAALRFARQQAVAQRRQVCVAVTAGGLAITRAQAVPPAVCNGTALPATIVFDALGQPNATAGLCVNGDGSFCLTVNAVSGYVSVP